VTYGACDGAKAFHRIFPVITMTKKSLLPFKSFDSNHNFQALDLILIEITAVGAWSTLNVFE
jgi:hypothetical protein